MGSPALRPLSEVDYQLNVTVPRHRVEARIDAELAVRGKRVRGDGYRPGKVPLGVLRKSLGPKVTRQVVQEMVHEAAQEILRSEKDLLPVGTPRIVQTTYASDGKTDVSAVLEVAVEPRFDLVSSSLGPVTRFTKKFSDADIEVEIQARLNAKGAFEVAGDGARVGTADRVTVDLVPVDAKGIPRGPWQHGAVLLMADGRLPEDLRGVVTGRRVGDSFIANVSNSGADGQYQVCVRKLEAWRVPALSELLGEESEDQYRLSVKAELGRAWEARSSAAVRQKMVDKFVQSHDFPVPKTLFEDKLDSLVVSELKQWRGQGDFNEEASRQRNQKRAENLARWEIVKGRLVREERLVATQSEIEAEYQRIAGPGSTVEEARKDFEKQPRFERHVAAQIEERHVYESIAKRFEVVEKDRDAVLQRRKH